jgi:hypothetical protein
MTLRTENLGYFDACPKPVPEAQVEGLSPGFRVLKAQAERRDSTDPRGARHGFVARSPWVAGTIEPLVVRIGDLRNPAERVDTSQDAFGQVRVRVVTTWGPVRLGGWCRVGGF